MPLLVEVADAHGAWSAVHLIPAGDPDGSISNNQPAGRDIILFRCERDRSVIYRSAAGFDMEVAGGRIVTMLGTEVLAVLGPGDSFELPVISDRGVAYSVRWTHQAGP